MSCFGGLWVLPCCLNKINNRIKKKWKEQSKVIFFLFKINFLLKISLTIWKHLTNLIQRTDLSKNYFQNDEHFETSLEIDTHWLHFLVSFAVLFFKLEKSFIFYENILHSWKKENKILTFRETEGFIFWNAASKWRPLTNSFSGIGFFMNSFRANSDASRTNADKSAPLEIN